MAKMGVMQSSWDVLHGKCGLEGTTTPLSFLFCH
jgi:hypothetical protein